MSAEFFVKNDGKATVGADILKRVGVVYQGNREFRSFPVGLNYLFIPTGFEFVLFEAAFPESKLVSRAAQRARNGELLNDPGEQLAVFQQRRVNQKNQVTLRDKTGLLLDAIVFENGVYVGTDLSKMRPHGLAASVPVDILNDPEAKGRVDAVRRPYLNETVAMWKTEKSKQLARAVQDGASAPVLGSRRNLFEETFTKQVRNSVFELAKHY
jgi:hypothetical protein